MTPNKQHQGSLVFIFITVLVDVIGVGIIIPVIPTLITELGDVGNSGAAEIGGYMLVAFAGMQYFFAPVLGELSDRFGRRPVLLFALLGLGVDYLIHAIAPTLTWLFIGRFLAGITGASYTVASSYIADVSTPENKAKNFGLIGAAFGLGFIIGPALGGLVGGWFGPRAPFYLAAGLTLLNFLFGLTILPESLPREKRRPMDFKRVIPFVNFFYLGKYQGILGLIMAFFLANVAGQVMPSTWTYYTIEVFEWTELEIGISLAVVGFMVAIVQAVLLKQVVKAFREKKTIIIGFIFWTFGMALFSFADTEWKLYAFLLPYILGGVASPTLQGLISNQVSPTEQGNLQGVLTSLISVSSITGYFLFPLLFSHFTSPDAEVYYPSVSFTAAGIIMLAGLLLIMISLKRIQEGAIHPDRVTERPLAQEETAPEGDSE